MRRVGLAIKRALDFLAAALLLLVLSPLLIAAAILIKFTSSGPVFFRQDRLGFNGNKFRIFKFRSMVVDAAKGHVVVVANDKRITGLGRYLRKYRIDELPQLINVLRGEMSLVGPRPLVDLFAHLWTQEERKRLNMPPGITGWQQINGAATNTWGERTKLDVWYVEHWNLWLDFKILLRTPWVVLKANTVYGKDGQERSAIPSGADLSIATPGNSSAAGQPSSTPNPTSTT